MKLKRILSDSRVLYFRCLLRNGVGLTDTDYITLGNELLECGFYQKAFHVFRLEIERNPDNASSYDQILNVYQRLQDWQRAYDLLDQYALRFPKNIEARITQGTLLTKMGRIAEAESLLLELKKKCQTLPAMWEALAIHYEAIHKATDSLACWCKAVECDRDNLTLLSKYILSLLDNLETEKALELYSGCTKGSEDIHFLLILPRIYLSLWDLDKALCEIQQVANKWPNDFAVLNVHSKILMNYAQSTGESKYALQAISILEAFKRAHPKHINVNVSLAKIYIHLGIRDEAIEYISNFPTSQNFNEDHMTLKSWQKYQEGNVPDAKYIWDQIQQRHYVRTIHAPLSKLERLDKRSLSLCPDSIVLFSVMYNELRRLNWFLDYYRKLGVTRFFIVDNASTDGSRDFLLQQDDVHLFLAEGRFAESVHGMRWINHLVERYGKDQWCIYVDADEALVYPCVEKFNLHHLISYMQDNKHEALSGFMMDMHGQNEEKAFNSDNMKNLITSYPFFNNNYKVYGGARCPYRNYYGGARNIFTKSHILVKTPIIRGGRNIKYLSSHFITPAIVSDVTAVLLHYKMTGDFVAHVKNEIKRMNRSSSCMRRHQKYLEVFESGEGDQVFVNEYSVKYESSEQLVALGLMECPEQYQQRYRLKKSYCDEKQKPGNTRSLPKETDQDLQQQFRSAIRQLNEGKLSAARKKFETLKDCYRDSPLGLVGLAQIENKHGNFQEALCLWDQATDYQPPVQQAFLGKAKTLMKLGSLDEAEKIYETTLEHWPECFDCRKGLISIAVLKKDNELLGQRQEEALSAKPLDPDILVSRALRALRLGETSQEETKSLIKNIITTTNPEIVSVSLINNILSVIKRLNNEKQQSLLLEQLTVLVDKIFCQHTGSKFGVALANIYYSRGEMDKMIQLINKLKETGINETSYAALLKIANKYESVDYPDHGATKVFGIGLSKTGTTSLHHSLVCLGHESLHWNNPHTKGLISEQDLFLFDAFTDVGISCQFENLFEKFPNSRFIYTSRSLESWVKSVQHHYYQWHKVNKPSELGSSVYANRFGGKAGEIEMNLYGRHESWKDAYMAYDIRVRNFFMDVSANRFLELKICNGEGWERLCPFLEKEIPRIPFPTKNSTYSNLN